MQRTRTDLAVVCSANTLILYYIYNIPSQLVKCVACLPRVQLQITVSSVHKNAEWNASPRMLLTGIHPASGASAVSLSRWLDADNLIQFMLRGATGGMDCYGVDPLIAINLSVLSPQTLALLYQLQ